MANSLFETVLASTVHDMKNSLSLIMNQLDNVSIDLPRQDSQAISTVMYEASRINTSLMEMLALYKLENKQLAVHIEEVIAIDIVEECVAASAQHATSRNVRIEIDCDNTLIWFFDADLVSIAISNIIGNSIRYAESLIRISVVAKDGELVIHIDDDGDGYPTKMLDEVKDFKSRVKFSSGSTGLGLYFAHTIADCHVRKNRRGHIRLRNGDRLSGGSFRMILP